MIRAGVNPVRHGCNCLRLPVYPAEEDMHRPDLYQLHRMPRIYWLSPKVIVAGVKPGNIMKGEIP